MDDDIDDSTPRKEVDESGEDHDDANEAQEETDPPSNDAVADTPTSGEDQQRATMSRNALITLCKKHKIKFSYNDRKSELVDKIESATSI